MFYRLLGLNDSNSGDFGQVSSYYGLRMLRIIHLLHEILKHVSIESHGHCTETSEGRTWPFYIRNCFWKRRECKSRHRPHSSWDFNFFHNTDHMLAQIAREPPHLICVLIPQSFILASEASEIACKTEYCTISAWFYLLSVLQIILHKKLIQHFLLYFLFPCFS